MRAGADEQEVAARPRVAIDRVARGLEGGHQRRARRAGGLLHFVHDQHHIGFGFLHQLVYRLRQGDAAGQAQGVELKAEGQARRAERRALDALEQTVPCPLQRAQLRAHRLQHQVQRRAVHVGPQIDVDDDGAALAQFGHQFVAQEGAFAHAPDVGQEDARAHAGVQPRGGQQLVGQRVGVVGARKEQDRHRLP